MVPLLNTSRGQGSCWKCWNERMNGYSIPRTTKSSNAGRDGWPRWTNADLSLNLFQIFPLSLLPSQVAPGSACASTSTAPSRSAASSCWTTTKTKRTARGAARFWARGAAARRRLRRRRGTSKRARTLHSQGIIIITDSQRPCVRCVNFRHATSLQFLVFDCQ